MLTKAERRKIRQKLEQAEYLLPGGDLAESMDLRAVLDSHDEIDEMLSDVCRASFQCAVERGDIPRRDGTPTRGNE